MIGKTIKIGTGLVAAAAAAITFFPSNAYADYAPSSGDVVGVGSDTLQQLGDFVADGFGSLGGYNTSGNINKFVSLDATADANTRLAYGTGGLGGTNACAPGTGGTAGTGNQNTNHTDAPCVLAPTVVLRAGTSPTQRPNGSGAGYNLLKADTDSSGNGKGLVDFSRASSARGSNAFYDSVTVGTDPLGILTSSTTNAVTLSTAQLTSIYNCSVTTWNDPSIGGSSSATIKPLLPQIGSGTRSSFLAAIGNPTLGSCVSNVEENDPEAIDASGSPANAIEPMSYGRLQLFLGKNGDGTPNDLGQGYFKDPSCPFPPAESTTPAACTGTSAVLAPNVKYWGPAGGGTGFEISRPLYLYFRHSAINSTVVFQGGGKLNWLRTMLYNPCSGVLAIDGQPIGAGTGFDFAHRCTGTGGNQYGPGGAPYVVQHPELIQSAGMTPAYAYTASGP
jgi:ABC-type phosphate transport system substrate-binding protein